MKLPATLYHTTPKRNIETILSEGLRPQKPDEWKGLIPTRYRNKKIIWLLGDRTTKSKLEIDTSMLDPTKLHKLNLKDVNWWFYVGVIPAIAIFQK